MRVGKNDLVVNVLIVQFTREWRERLTVALDRNLVLSPLGMYPSQKNCPRLSEFIFHRLEFGDQSDGCQLSPGLLRSAWAHGFAAF
jgi:hypothetical protein